MVRYADYSMCYSFKYSARPGTPAANMGALVPEHIKSERLTELQKLTNERQAAFNKKCEGLSMPVLLERPSRDGQSIIGHTEYYQTVQVDNVNKRLLGKIENIMITKGSRNALHGKIELLEKVS